MMRSLLGTVTTVLSAFVGIRRKTDHDAVQPVIKPVHIVVTAVVLVLLIIAGLLMLVKTITTLVA